MKFALFWTLLIIADAVQACVGGPAVFAATSIRSGRVASGPVGIKASTRHRRGHGSRFRAPLVVDGISADNTSVTVEQTQSLHPAPAKERKDRLYVPPRWVSTEYGVEILEPGRWIEIDAAREP